MSGTDTTRSGIQKAKVGRATVYRTVNPGAWLGFFAVNPTSIPTQPAANTSAMNAASRKRHLPPMNTTNIMKSLPASANPKTSSSNTSPTTAATGAKNRRRNVSQWPLTISSVVSGVHRSNSSAPVRRDSEKKRLAWMPTSIRAGAVSSKLAKGTLKKTRGVVGTPIPQTSPMDNSVATQANRVAIQVIHGHAFLRLFSQ